MTTLKTEEIEIVKTENNKNHCYYTIKINQPNRSLLLSFIKSGILLGATISDQYQSITFRANKVEIYNNNKTQSYETALQCFYHLSKQIEYLITKENKCFYRVDPKKIIVIDENKYIYVNTNNDDLVEIEEGENLVLYLPFQKNTFDSPEIKKITQIPAKIHYKTLYYSLAKFILFLLSNDEPPEREQEQEQQEQQEQQEEQQEELKKIKGTKLFYTLERCLQEEPKKRSLLFI
jgi:hypothetical protein